ncbi:MAG TPA: c-type cytochrome [Candidatus Binatia bacterium]|nr:c-type cytochrome [Candidatus Binatia bacterium]
MSFNDIRGRLALSMMASLVFAGLARAQDSAVAAAAERPLTSGAFSAKQAERGEGVYKTSCQSCHAKSEYTGDKFKVAWVSKSVFDVFNQIRTEMPEDNPGSLERQQYIDVVAYIFSLNAYPAGENDLPGDDDGLEKIKIDNPPGQFSLRQSLRAIPSAPRAVAHPRVTFRK